MIEDVQNVIYWVYAKIRGDIPQVRVSNGQIEKTIVLVGLFPYVFVPIALFVIMKANREGTPI